MPVEINELVVRIVVDPSQPRRPPADSAGGTKEREELVKQCVEAVLDVLREKQER